MARGLWSGLVACMAAGASAQLLYSGGILEEDFNALPTAPAPTVLDNWVDNSTLPGWHRKLVSDGTPGVENRFRVDNGSSTGGSLWSLGVNGSAERALGFTTSSNLPTIHIGARVVNQTGGTLTAATISYHGEQWREGAAGGNSLRLATRFGSGALDAGIWTERPELHFHALHTAGPAQARNGNLAENRALVSATVTGINWLPGQELWLRWSGADRPGADHTLAIDDLWFSAVPEPAGLAAVWLGVAGLLRRRKPRG